MFDPVGLDNDAMRRSRDEMRSRVWARDESHADVHAVLRDHVRGGLAHMFYARLRGSSTDVRVAATNSVARRVYADDIRRIPRVTRGVPWHIAAESTHTCVYPLDYRARVVVQLRYARAQGRRPQPTQRSTVVASATEDNLSAVVARSAELQEQIVALVAAGEPFEHLVGDYAAALAAEKAATREARSTEIAAAKSLLGEIIAAGIENCGIAELIDEPVRNVVYEFVPATGADGADMTILNVNAKVRAKRTAAKGDGNGTRRQRPRKQFTEDHPELLTDEDRAELATADAISDASEQSKAQYVVRNRVWVTGKKAGVEPAASW